MSSKNTATEIKRHVGGNYSNLYLAEHDGDTWATNRYWLTRSKAVAPLLEKFNVPLDATGTYEVNGSVRKQNDNPPKVRDFLQLSTYDQPLARVKIAGRHAYVPDGAGNYLALFTTPDGTHKAVRADWLEWLTEAGTPVHYGERHGEPRYMISKSALAIIADREVQHGGCKGDDGEWIPLTWESKGPELLAVIMTVKVDS
jgi:hypothetical protein